MDILIFGHKHPDTDTICSSIVTEILTKKYGLNTKAVRLGNINKETQYVLDYLGIDAPELLEKIDENQEVILVDHNEFSQSIDGIENAKVLGVIDHHRIANFQTKEPLYYTAKPYGCTSTILFEEFNERGYEIGKTEAILMASAIISDTLLLKSPTTTEHDKTALIKLGQIAGINIEEYGLNMLKAGTDLSDFTADELINIDSKEMINGNFKFQVSQVNTACIDDVLKNKQEIETAIKSFMAKNGTDLYILLITDIINSNSQAIVLGETSIFEKAFNKTLVDNTVLLEGVVSRKKQITPVISSNI